MQDGLIWIHHNSLLRWFYFCQICLWLLRFPFWVWDSFFSCYAGTLFSQPFWNWFWQHSQGFSSLFLHRLGLAAFSLRVCLVGLSLRVALSGLVRGFGLWQFLASCPGFRQLQQSLGLLNCGLKIWLYYKDFWLPAIKSRNLVKHDSFQTFENWQSKIVAPPKEMLVSFSIVCFWLTMTSQRESIRSI